ncbi:hypothetical protein [uncultured Brachyspira sp.]|uniref:hypothetical protein n=1 Tax=uncultured Brachyspira sp. TaxID=221953 RepID=UPI00262261CA|nr:hypothetical protein [uncultured Brachyspira sp.]
MQLKEKSIIELENIHKIEPFFIRYLTIISSVILLILFIFFFGTNRLNEEYNTVNVWNKETQSIEPPSHDNNFNIDGIFKQNFFTKPEGIVHYFDFNGDTIYSTNLARGELATANNQNFIIYKRYGNYIDAYNNMGIIIWRTNTSIYPEIAPYAERIIYHSSDNSKIQMFDFNNNPLSRHIQYGEIITDGAFALNTGDYIAGFSSGDIAYINRNGNLSFAISTILSEINIVKSVAISEYGSFAMSVSGIRPEYMTLYDANGSTMWYLETGLNRRRHVSSYVSEKSMTAFMLADRDIILYTLNKGKEIDRINLEKYNMMNAVNMKLNSETNSTIMSVSKDAKSVVLIYDNNAKEIVFEKYLDGWVYNLDISSLENEYMIVSDKMIYTYKRVKL